jgi:hypothetical protein
MTKEEQQKGIQKGYRRKGEGEKVQHLLNHQPGEWNIVHYIGISIFWLPAILILSA